MKVKYEVTAKFTVLHDLDEFENLKGSNEFATDLAHMVCDEASMCGAVATYEILQSTIDVTDEQENENADGENTVYKDFMKNSYR